MLSWSLLEAMSAGCAIVASDTAPLREAIRHDETGVLVDFSTRPRWPKPPANCWTTQPGAHAWGRPLASLPVRITT